LLIQIWGKSETEKVVKVTYNNKVIKKETVKMLTHEEQLNKLLDLGLTIHPLTRDGPGDNPFEKYNCWGIFASTPEKAIQRFNMIKRNFPKAVHIKLKSAAEGDFGVDLYGEF
jgi:hypothetical protein